MGALSRLRFRHVKDMAREKTENFGDTKSRYECVRFTPFFPELLTLGFCSYYASLMSGWTQQPPSRGGSCENVPKASRRRRHHDDLTKDRNQHLDRR